MKSTPRREQRRVGRRLAAVVAGLAMAAAACGGGSATITESQVASGSESPTQQAVEPTAGPTADVATAEPTPEPPTSTPAEAADTEVADNAVPDTEAADSPATDAAAEVSDGADLPSAEVSFEPPVVGGAISIDAIPELLDLHAAAYEDPSLAPLQVAADLIGFPIGLPAPSDGNLITVESWVDAADDGRLGVNWQYGVEDASAAEYQADENDDPVGPPVDLIVGTYPPYWEANGLEFQNSASDRSNEHPSGRGSYQLYYRPIDELELVTPTGSGTLHQVGVAAWSDFDLSDRLLGETPQPGYWQRVSGFFDATTVPIPLVQAVREIVPVTGSMELDEARLATKLNDPESSNGAFGTRSLFLRMIFEVPMAEYDATVAHFATNPFDPTQVRYARIDMFSEEPSAIEDSMDPTADRPGVDLVLLDRYPGRLSISPSAADDETFTVRIEFDLEPGRPLLG